MDGVLIKKEISNSFLERYKLRFRDNYDQAHSLFRELNYKNKSERDKKLEKLLSKV